MEASKNNKQRHSWPQMTILRHGISIKRRFFFSNFKPNRNPIHHITGIKEDEEQQWDETSGLKQTGQRGRSREGHRVNSRQNTQKSTDLNFKI